MYVYVRVAWVMVMTKNVFLTVDQGQKFEIPSSNWSPLSRRVLED